MEADYLAELDLCLSFKFFIALLYIFWNILTIPLILPLVANCWHVTRFMKPLGIVPYLPSPTLVINIIA